MTQPVAVPLRIVVDQPIPGLALALQCGKDRLQPPAFASAERVIFDLALRLGSPNPDGSPNLLGPCAQGTPTARFVYLCVGRRAGQAASTTDGRVKVPLAAITNSQLCEVSRTGKRLAVRIPARNAKGAPTLATVPLTADAWTVVPDALPTG